MPLDNPSAAVVQEAWKALTLQSGWANFGGGFNPAGYWKDTAGVVHLRGVLLGDTYGTGLSMFAFPVGYRPANTEALMTVWFTSTKGYGIGRIDISSAGSAVCQFGPPANPGTIFFMDGLTFRANQT